MHAPEEWKWNDIDELVQRGVPSVVPQDKRLFARGRVESPSQVNLIGSSISSFSDTHIGTRVQEAQLL